MRESAPLLPDWLDAMLPDGLRRYRVDVGGYFMHVMEVGDGRPVLMLHGNPTWGFLYRRVAAALAGQPLRLIMPDLIGLGFSDKPVDATAHQLDNHIGWMARLIEVLDLQDLILVGQDWGGPIGFGALQQMPERLGGLVVLNTVPGPPKPGFRPTAFHRFARAPLVSDAVFRLLGFPQIALFAAQGDKRSIRGRVARAYRYPLRGLRNNLAPLALARMVPDGPGHASIAALARGHSLIEAWDGPAAIVWGDRDPVLGSVRTAFERLLPQAAVIRTRAGHFLQEEVPEEIAAAIRTVAGTAGPI
ncbi:MAG TPA: alpha/beta fold hydrolase [Kofleriaceae bacterium]|nr:alpha/beta fold hydrolase [Kofleriaceae bacterium]